MDSSVALQAPFELVETDREAREVAFCLERVGPKKFVLPGNAHRFLQQFREFKPRSADVVVMAYQRSGCTVLSEMVWLICNDLDVEKAKRTPLTERAPCLDQLMIFDREAPMDGTEVECQYIYDVWQRFTQEEGVRFLRCLLPFSLLSSEFLATGCKTVYIIRDVRDVMVSTFKMIKRVVPPEISLSILDFTEFARSFMRDEYIWCPYWEYIKEAWDHRKKENFLFMNYKGLVTKRKETIQMVAIFLGKPLANDQLDIIDEYIDVKFSRTSTPQNQGDPFPPFVPVEDEWKRHFTGDLEIEVNDWIEANREKYRLPSDLFETVVL